MTSFSKVVHDRLSVETASDGDKQICFSVTGFHFSGVLINSYSAVTNTVFIFQTGHQYYIRNTVTVFFDGW